MSLANAIDGARQTLEPPRAGDLGEVSRLFVDGWPGDAVQTDYLRASGIYDLCPRAFVLNYWEPRPGKRFGFASRLKMSVGTHLHDYLQNRVLGPLGVLSGTWLHGRRRKIVEGFSPDSSFGAEDFSWRFVEQRVWDEEHRISGHTDGEVSPARLMWLWENRELLSRNPGEAVKRVRSVDAGELVLLEVKTVGARVLERTKTAADLPDYYRAQACVYQQLTDVRRTLFWYLGRDDAASRVFFYDFEEGWWRTAQRKARIVWKSVRDEVLPDAMMACGSANCRRASTCPHRDKCWRVFRGQAADLQKHAVACRNKQPRRKWLDLSEKVFD